MERGEINLYGTARVRNGHLNYQGTTAGITFNPGGVFEHELSWQSLAKILIGKYGHKKPVKMVSVDAPEKPKKKDNEMPGPAKCTTGKSKSGICGAAAYCDTEYKCCAQCPDDCNSRCGWLEERCQPAAETPDEKQHDFVEDTKIADHPGETTEMPRNNTSGIGIRTNGISITYDSWPPELKNIPLPTESEMVGYLYDEEQKLKEILDKEKKSPWITQKEITKQQLIVGGLRLIKQFIEDCQK